MNVAGEACEPRSSANAVKVDEVEGAITEADGSLVGILAMQVDAPIAFEARDDGCIFLVTVAVLGRRREVLAQRSGLLH